MLTARSVAAAARQANVGQSTLRRWLREDDNFEPELHRYREEALCFASLNLQRNLAWVVGLMYEFIKTDAPVPHGKVTLIRTAIEYAFRSAVYCDIVGRVRALERIQRQNQSDGNNPPSAAAPPSLGATPPLTAISQPIPNKALHKPWGPRERIFADLLIPAPTPPSRMNRFFVNLLTTAQSGPRNPSWRTAPPCRPAPVARGPGKPFPPQHRNQPEWTRNMPSFARSASQECGQSA